MTAVIGVVVAGLAFGALHAVEPDHVLAITALMARQERRGSMVRVALWWALGHNTTLVFGVGALVAAGAVEASKWGSLLEIPAIVMLAGLGALSIVVRPRSGAAQAREVRRPAVMRSLPKRKRQWIRGYVIGLVHGAAGSGALTMLVIASFSTPFVAILYLLAMLVGSAIGMVLIASLLARSKNRNGAPRVWSERVLALAGCASVLWAFAMTRRLVGG